MSFPHNAHSENPVTPVKFDNQLMQIQFDSTCSIYDQVVRSFKIGAQLWAINPTTIAFVHGHHICVPLPMTLCEKVQQEVAKAKGVKFGHVVTLGSGEDKLPPKTAGFSYGDSIMMIPLPW